MSSFGSFARLGRLLPPAFAPESAFHPNDVPKKGLRMTDSDTGRDADDASKNGNGAKTILAEARKDWDAAELRERYNIRLAYEDLEFLAGDELSQWPEKQRWERENDGRPTLQINQLPQFVHQITGDIRQLRPSIKVIPVDSAADEQIADLRGGLIRCTENRSDASAIYFRAADSQVACGIGHWRVATEYADSSAVLWDPDAILPTREDARYCFVPVDMSRNAFEAAYPGVTPGAFDDAGWAHNSSWLSDDHVRVAEYWVKKPAKKLLALGRDGAIADITGADDTLIARHRAKGARIEERDSALVCRYLIAASGVLEGPEELPGRFIPIVPGDRRGNPHRAQAHPQRRRPPRQGPAADVELLSFGAHRDGGAAAQCAVPGHRDQRRQVSIDLGAGQHQELSLSAL